MKRLKAEMQNYAYFSVQELILETLRQRFLHAEKPEKRGRPRKIDETAIMTRSKIFSRKGKPLDL